MARGDAVTDWFVFDPTEALERLQAADASQLSQTCRKENPHACDPSNHPNGPSKLLKSNLDVEDLDAWGLAQRQLSQESQAIFPLSKEEHDMFEERAAIMEFDGGLSREDAERRARLVILKARD